MSRTGSPGAEPVTAPDRRRLAAVERLYRRHGASVYGLLCAQWGPARAEELTIRLFAALFEDPAGLDPDPATLRAALVAASNERVRSVIRRDQERRSGA